MNIKKYMFYSLILMVIFLPLKIHASTLDGNYSITSKLDNNMVLDIAGGTAKEDANIQLYSNKDSLNQQWKFIYNDGYYKIASTQNNDFCLAFDNETYSIKSNVKIAGCNDSQEQNWLLEQDSDGYYKILSYDEQFVLDVAGAVARNNANIQLYTSNNNANQRFAINKIVTGTKTIEDGVYKISSNNSYMTVNGDKADNKVKINFSSSNNSKSQKWLVTYLDNGIYQISSAMNKNYSIDVPGNKKVKNISLQLFQNNYGKNQQWIIKDNGDGTYKVISKANGLCFDTSDNNLIMNEETEESSQNLVFELCDPDNNAIINDGVYIISSKLKDNMVLDVAGGRARENANIQLYLIHYLDNQKWHFVYDNAGYYYIKSELDNNYCLSIKTNEFVSHNGIVIKECNNLLEQRWQLEQDNDRYYKIISNNDLYVLDVTGAKSVNNTKIQLFDDINSPAQKFIINKDVTGTKTIESGVYTISTTNGNYINIDDNAENKRNINVSEANDSDRQKWLITYLSNGYYKIESLNDRRYLMDIAGAKKLSNINVQLFSANGGYNQQWIIKDNEDGTYKIISRLSGMNLDVVNNNVIVNEDSSSNTQNFVFNETTIGNQEIEDGYYFVNAKINLKKSMDVAGAVAIDNKNVQIFSNNSGLNQKWHFQYLGDGYYSILSNINEEYALTLSEDGNVQINKYEDLANQKWIVKKNSDDYYSIINSEFNAISIYDSKTIDKTNILKEEYYYNDNQKFKLIKTVEGITIDEFADGYYSISSSINNDYVIDVAGAKTANNTNIQLYASNSKKNQKWYFEKHNNYYIIKSGLDNSKVLTVDNNTSPANVKLYDINSSYEQQWVIKKNEDESYSLASNSNGLYLNISENRVENNLNIQTDIPSDIESQKFNIPKTRLENIVIDISAHNGVVDWDKIKNDGQIYGAILRVAAGSYYIDSKLEYNVAALNRLKMPYGIYIYSYAEDVISTVPDLGTYHEAKLEALRLITAIENFNINPTLGIYYDLEVWENARNANWTSQEYEKIINNFHEVMLEHGYGDWKIYANLNMANTSLYPWRERITWIAQWNNQCTYTSFYNLWQYTSDGHVDGVPSERVDMNIYYID